VTARQSSANTVRGLDSVTFRIAGEGPLPRPCWKSPRPGAFFRIEVTKSVGYAAINVSSFLIEEGWLDSPIRLRRRHARRPMAKAAKGFIL